MPFPDFITALPTLDVPFPEEVVQSGVIKSDRGLAVFFTFLQEVEIPAHSHGAQWGTVIAGELHLRIGGTERVCRPGDSYEIPAGVEHGARATAGTQVIDVFEEADRYPLRA